MIRIVILFGLISCLFGCTSFSQDSLRRVDTSVHFNQLVATPDTFVGRTVMLGGVIAANLTTPEGSALEIVQYDLADDHVPTPLSVSQGRFFATSPVYAETAQYRPGDLVSVIGELKGKRTFMREGVEQVCPILAIREIKAWNRSEEIPPSLQSNYDPYFWGYPGDPYSDRPAGPVLKRY